MISGRQTLGSLDDTLTEQRDKIDAVDRRIEALGQRLVALQTEQLRDYRELARHRADDIASGAVLGSIDRAEKKARGLLQQRQVALQELTAKLGAGEESRSAREDQRSVQADVLEAVAERVDAAEAELQERLDLDPAYQKQRERASEAHRTALHAREKSSRSEKERHDKGAPYEEDALFMYLWARAYGTSQYGANPLARWLDAWVARLIGYDDARANYHRLQEIPLRLKEHAQRAEELADEEFRALEQLDVNALESHGVVALEDQQAREQEKLDVIDERIEGAEAATQVLLERKERYAVGEDEKFQSVVRYLSAEFAADDLRELRDAALATPYPEDDMITARLIDAEQEKGEIERSTRELKKLMLQHRKRLQELEATRMEFKRRRYDNPRSGFSDGALVGVVLGNLLNGVMKNDSLWDVLQQQQRHNRGRSRPDFGSGGFGRGTMWGGGRQSPGGGPSGGFGGGGFRTGGGFGGGGGDFRTGGGF